MRLIIIATAFFSFTMFAACKNDSNNKSDAASQVANHAKDDTDSIAQKFGIDYKTNGLPEATAANDAKRETNTMALGEMDAAFVMRGFIASTTEIKTSKLELEGGADERVKKFAQDIMDSHTKIREGIQTLAANKNVTLPVEVGELHEIKQVAETSSGERDKTYVQLMVKNHSIFLDKFKQGASNGNDDGLKAWAASIIPVLEANLAKAKALWETIK